MVHMRRSRHACNQQLAVALAAQPSQHRLARPIGARPSLWHLYMMCESHIVYRVIMHFDV